jgi:hypothetical protein
LPSFRRTLLQQLLICLQKALATRQPDVHTGNNFSVCGWMQMCYL